MEAEDYIKVVENLNEELFSKGEEDVCFSYITNTHWDAIQFADITIWDSEHCERKWIEEENRYELFEPFIKRVFNKFVEDLHKLKF